MTCHQHENTYAAAAEVIISLNADNVRFCNNQSMYNAGNLIAVEAQGIYKKFFFMFPLKEDYTERQKAYLCERVALWKDLVESAYNEDLRRRSDIVPVTVAGASNYPAERMNKRMDKRMSRQQEWSDKMDHFANNTSKGLYALTPSEVILEQYRTGQTDVPIMSDDPLAIEKLKAKHEFLVSRQKEMKAANAHYRKHKTMRGYLNLSDEAADRLDREIKAGYSWQQCPYPPFELTNNNAIIRTTKERIASLDRHREQQPLSGYHFNGGEVVTNYSIDRLQVIFDEKPNSDIRSKMKLCGFRWAPSEAAWQRQLTANAMSVAKSLFEEVK